MTTPTPSLKLLEDAIGRVDALAISLDKLANLFAHNQTAVHKQRRRDKVAAAGLLAVVGLVLFLNHRTSSQFDATHTAAIAACEATNGSNAKQRALWDGLLTLPKTPGTPETPPEVLVAFTKLLDTAYAHRDCANDLGNP